MSRPTDSRPPDLVGVGLTLLALATAAVAQAYVRDQPWWSIAGFAVGGVLFVLAARRHPPPAEPPPAPPPRLSTPFLVLLGVGFALCDVAAFLSYEFRKPILSHALWLGGLLAFAAAAALGSRVGRRERPQRATVLAVAALLLLSLLVFGWQVTALPVEVHGDDAEVGLDAIRLLANFNLFSAGWFELPRFHALPTAIGLELFGYNLLGLRATSVAFGMGAVVLLFLVGRQLWDFEVGLLAALLLIAQRFFIHLSRAGYHYIDTPFLSLLVVWLLLRLWQDGRRGAAVWCGVALGLGFQTYYASRLVPVLLAVTFVLWLCRTPTREWQRRIATFAVIGLVTLSVLAPLLGFFAHDWDSFWKRTRETSVFSARLQEHLRAGYQTDSLTTIIAIQLRNAIALFNARADNSVQYGLNAPLFDAVSAMLFVLAIAVLLARIRERRAQLVLLWTAVPLVAGAALTIDTPFFPRISGLVPFAVLMVALALRTVLDAVRAALPTRAGVRVASALTAAALVLIYAENLRTYFVDYAARYRHSSCVEIAAWVRAHGAGKTTYMVGSAPGFYIGHGAINFLTIGYRTQDIVDLDRFLKTSKFDPATSLFVIMPHGIHIIPQVEQTVGPIDLQTHRKRDGSPAFLTAIPHSAASNAPAPIGRFDQPSEPSAAIRAFGDMLLATASAARWTLGALGALVVVLAVFGRVRTPRRPGVSALAVPLRERAARWQRRLFGPDARERLAELPPRAVIALLVVILALAFALRVFQLVDLPAGFFCDEAGNGYNAYSLLHTGRDETGARWPLYVWSFGVSYKNPVFIYSAMLPMALLGPSELAVRLTAALYGFGAVVAMFFLGRALMGTTVGLIAALLLAVCPWHLHFSRIGFELIALPFFFTLALTSLVRWTQGQRTLPQAMVLFGICLYTYVPAKLIVPLFLAGFAALYARPLLERWRESALALALFIVTAAPMAIFDLAHREQAGSYFRNTTVLASDESAPAIVAQFARNYVEFFSPEFLFESSNDKIIRHTVSDHGQLYPFFAPLLVLGALAALLRRDRAMRLPLLWLALYPLAPALMNEIPSASRGIAGAPAFALLAAIGAGAVLRLATQISARRAVIFAVQAVLALAGIAVLVPAVRHYWRLYHDEYPLYAAKEYTGFQFGHRQVLDFFRQHYDEYDLELLTTRKSNQADVFLRFYDGLRQPARTDIMPPYEHRERMQVGDASRYQHYQTPDRRMLFAVLADEVPLFADADVKERVIAPDGTAAFVIVAASRLRDFVSTWMVHGPLPEDDHSPPPNWAPDHPPRGRSWRLYDQPAAGVGLNDFFSDNADYACAWALNFVTSDVERDVRVFAGFDDRGEVWVNGEQVELQATEDPEATLVDHETGTLHLRADRNTIAVRTCETVADWRFYFRLENLDGTPVEGLEWEYGPRAEPE